MKLFTVYSPTFEVIKQIFLSSMQDDYDVHMTCLEDIQEVGFILDAAHQQSMMTRHRIALDAINQNMGEIVLVTDLDLLFFGKTQPMVEEAMQGRDMAVQLNGSGLMDACLGFTAIRCNEVTRVFWETFIDRYIDQLQDNPRAFDQDLFNTMLQESDLRWGFFPSQVYHTQHGWPPPEDLLVYHATGVPISAVEGDTRTPLDHKIMLYNSVLKALGMPTLEENLRA